MKRKEVTDFLDKYDLEYRPGKAPRGDSLDQLRVVANDWLGAPFSEVDSRTNAENHNIVVDKLRITQLLTDRGNFPPLFTPPFYSKLHPIEDLWRHVKQYVVRQYSRCRTFNVMEADVVDGFKKYGTIHV